MNSIVIFGVRVVNIGKQHENNKILCAFIIIIIIIIIKYQ